MLPIIGPWCSTEHFTDTDLLVALSADSRDLAVGILTNRNLTGTQLSTVADRANLTVANVEKVKAANLIEGRTAEDQVTLLLAANHRSTAAGSRLLGHMDADGLLLLHRRCTSSRFKGATGLLQQIVHVASYPGFVRYCEQDGFAALLDLTHEGEYHPGRLLAATTAAFGDRDLLWDLTATIAATSDTNDLLVDALLLASYGHPDVVTHWATEGGLLGRKVAARDHRQDPAWLTRLPAGHGVWAILLTNPALNDAQHAKILGRRMRKVATKRDRVRYRAMALVHQAEAAAELRTTFRKIRLDDIFANEPKRLASLYNRWGSSHISSLLSYEIFTGSRLGRRTRLLVAGHILEGDAVPGAVQRTLKDDLGTKANNYYYGSARDQLNALIGRPLVPRDYTPPATAPLRALLFAEMCDYPLGLHSTLPAFVSSRLTSIDQWRALYTMGVERASTLTLGDAVTWVVAENPHTGEPATELAALLPSALGAL